MKYNIILRFLEYEKKENYQRLLFFIGNVLIHEFQKIINTYNLKKLQLLYTILFYYYRKYISIPIITKKDLNIFEKYFVPEYEVFLNAVFGKITNEKLKLEYEEIFKNYFENVFRIWIFYNIIIGYIVSYVVLIFMINNIDKIEGTKQSFIDKIPINIYLFIKLIRSLNISRGKKQEVNKNYIYNEINNIYRNEHSVKEVSNEKFHFDNIIKDTIKVYNEAYNKEYSYPSIKITNLDEEFINSLFITFMNFFLKYNKSVQTIIAKHLKTSNDNISWYFSEINHYIQKNEKYELLLREFEYKNYDQFIIDHTDPVLFSLKKIRFQYDNKNTVFSNVSLSIPISKWITIKGKSGNGKSTLIQFLLQRSQTYNPQEGQILFQKKSYIYNNIKHLTTFLDNESGIFHNNSILFNITYGIKTIDEKLENKVKEYLTLFKMSLIVDRLDDMIDNLSTGQKQRIKLIRLILHDRPIWILDEATSNLDQETEKIILTHLRELQQEKQKTVFFISHHCNDIFSDIIYQISNKTISIV